MATRKSTKTSDPKPTASTAKKPVVTLVSVSTDANEDIQDPVVADSAPAPQAASDDAAVLRKKELFDRVVEATGAKRRDVKPIVEATLKVLGDALSGGNDLVLPPLGKAKVNKQKDLGAAEMLVIRLRRQDEKSAKAVAGEEADAE